MPFNERYVTTTAAGGGNGLTEGTAWTLAEAVASYAAGQRINLKDTGVFNRTTGDTVFTAGARFEGYSVTPGDGGRAVIDGGTTGASYVLFNDAAGNIELVNLEFRNNGATGAANGVVLNSESSAVGVVVHDIRGAGLLLGQSNGVAVECEAFACNQSNTAGKGGFQIDSHGHLVRCFAHDNVGSSNNGIVVGGNFVTVTLDQCVVDSNGLHGVLSNNLSILNVRKLDAFGNGGDGLRINNSGSTAMMYVESSNFVRNGGYGINGIPADRRMGHVRNCGFGSGTEANTSGTTNSLDLITVSGSVIYDANVTPWVSPSTGDFRINLIAAKGAGRGTFVQTASGYTGTVGYPDIGAAQHSDAVAPAQPDPAAIAVADLGNGAAVTVSVTDSTVGSVNDIYVAEPKAGTLNWVKIGSRAGDGEVSVFVAPGPLLYKVVSTANGYETEGQSVYLSVNDFKNDEIYDRADGTGINVYAASANPTDVVTAEILDTTQTASWRDGPNRTGPGLLNVPVGETDATVNFARTYRIRYRVNSSGGTLIRQSASKLVTPTQGYDSPDFSIMVNLTHALIEADIRRIGGNIHRVMYPIPAVNVPDLPAIFIFQQEPETLGNLDNRSYTEDLPIVVQIADSLVEDWAKYIEWWHYVRRIVKKTLHRVAAYKLGQYPTGRRFRVTPGQFFLTEYEGKYLFRAQNLTVRADLEFPIEG